MKKASKIITSILCVAALFSAFTFTACSSSTNSGNQGENGGNTQTGDKGNQGDNTQTGGDKEPEHVPVTTVANEEEWRNAFKKFFTSDNLSAKCTMDFVRIDNISSNIDESFQYPTLKCSLDYVNDKFRIDYRMVYPTKEVKEFSAYYEINNNVVYAFWNEAGNNVDIPNYDTNNADEIIERYDSNTSNAERKLIYYSFIDNVNMGPKFIFASEFYTGGSNSDKGLIMDLYSNFTYSNGYYTSNKLYYKDNYAASSSEVQMKVAVKNGVLSEIDCKITSSVPDATLYSTINLKVDKVNSTTVTAPDGAREAIDAEIAKG